MPKRRRRKSRFRRRSSSKFTKQKLIFYGIIFIIVSAVVGFLCILAVFAWYSRDLPQPGKLSETRKNSTVFYDRNDEVIYEMYKDENRIPVGIEDIPKKLQQATIAIEDKNFYGHGGISQMGILRAAIMNAFGKKQGGSTITQQLIKKVLLTSDRKISRKIKEFILANQAEKKYTKDEILEMYLNEVPYGGTYVGVGSASRGYFDKDPKDLTLLESAFLAGLPQNPSSYSPFVGKKDAWKPRTKDVLRRMREDAYITKDEEEKALSQIDKLKFSKTNVSSPAPHFVFYLQKIIDEDFGEGLLNQGVKVKTTLDLDLQKKAEKIVKDEIESLEDYNVGNGALVAIQPETGEIIAYVGSYDFNDATYGKFDVVSQGDRQPGSTLKPIEYSVALKKGYTAASLIMDVPTEFPNSGGAESYTPENYDKTYRGPVQVRYALGNSLNIPAVKMLAMVGLRDFMQQLYDMGLDSMEPTQANMNNLGLSASLGGGETTLLNLTEAFAVFANGGEHVSPSGILEIKDFDGKSIYKKKTPKKNRVLSEEISFIISDILSDNNARISTFGPNSELKISGKTVAVKSGTTDDKRDNWAVGFTKDIALGVWVGNNDNEKMNQNIASGVTGASPIWHDFMTDLLDKYKDGIISKPSGVTSASVDSFLGGAPVEGRETRTEYFIEGTVPDEESPYYKTIKISKANGKIANEVEEKTGNYEEKSFYMVEENDPISTDGTNRWQLGIDNWAKDQGDEKWHYPTEVSDSKEEGVGVIVSIKDPPHEAKYETSDKKVNFRATITSLENIKETKVFLNGAEVISENGDRDEIEKTFELDDGKYEIKVQAWNEKGESGDSTIKFGVNQDWQ